MPCSKRHDDAECIALDDDAHQLCTGWSASSDEMIYWLNPAYVPPKVLEKGSARRQAVQMAARVQPATSVDDEPQEGSEPPSA